MRSALNISILFCVITSSIFAGPHGLQRQKAKDSYMTQEEFEKLRPDEEKPFYERHRKKLILGAMAALVFYSYFHTDVFGYQTEVKKGNDKFLTEMAGITFEGDASKLSKVGLKSVQTYVSSLEEQMNKGGLWYRDFDYLPEEQRAVFEKHLSEWRANAAKAAVTNKATES